MLLHSQVLSMDNRTKGLSLWGSRMQTHRVKCLTSCPRVLKNHMRLGYTTCQITQGSTRRSADAKFQDFFPPCKTLQTDFEISSKTTMPECHANLFLTKTPCRLLEKATLAKECLTGWQKNPMNLWLVWSIPHSADRGGTLCLDFQRPRSNSAVAGGHVLHFLLDTLTSTLTCLLELGLRNWALSLDED